jgi:arylformamidase
MIYDISPPLSPRLAVWPGDTPLSREILSEIGQPSAASKIVSTITLSTLRATAHLGAHADAPSHYGAGAPPIDARDLDYYLGPCQVIRVPVTRGGCATADAIRVPITAPRVLLDTGTQPDLEQFPEDFAALSPDLVTWLHRQGVRLVGIDTPSVDPFPSKDLPAHQTFLRHDMAILEGLVLKDVPEGIYELIALPLRLVGFDASPVRAVLRALP